LRAEAAAFRNLDHLIHRRVIGDAREPENLIECEPQYDLQRGLLRSARCLPHDEPVERGLPAHNAIDKLLQQSTIGRIQA
jgi:hypothetical protein